MFRILFYKTGQQQGPFFLNMNELTNEEINESTYNMRKGNNNQYIIK